MKKFLLPTLLASLVLCGCNVQPIENNERQFEAVEGTDADDYLFENAKLINDFEVTDSSVPSIGIQRTNEHTDHLAIRFIAAIKVNDTNDNGVIDEEELQATSAVWYRDVFCASGGLAGTSQVGGLKAKESKTAYVAFNNGGSRYTIEQFNADHGTSYTHFVTYVLKNIDQGAYAYDPITVYLKLNENVYSQCAVTTVEGDVNFSIDYDKTGFFGVLKNSDGSIEFFSPISSTDTRTYFNKSINANTSFMIAYRQTESSSRFRFYDYFDRNYHLGEDDGLTRDGSSGYFKTKGYGITQLYIGLGYTAYQKHQATMSISTTRYQNVDPDFSINDCGSYILSGIYPQNNRITDADLIATLNNTSQTAIGWYEYNHEYYAKVVATPASENEYFNDNSTKVVSGETYWFKCEPIKWVVYKTVSQHEEYWKDDYQTIFVSYEVLDAHTYSNVSSADTTRYENSDIRAWLNGEFYDTAFPYGDMGFSIRWVDNDAASTGDSTNPYASGYTQDQVFLLSRTEYKIANSAYENNNDMRTRSCTDWAIARGVDGVQQGNYRFSSYWTRSPSTSEGIAYNISAYGNANSTTSITNKIGVVPCLAL